VQIGPSKTVQEEVAGAIKEMVFPTMTHLDQRNVKSLHTRIEENRLIVSKADKGNAVVIMERSLYHSKIVQAITDMGGVESGGFSFDFHVAEVRRVIGGCCHILKTLPIRKYPCPSYALWFAEST